jgi:4-amino-4-deoxy-L-arabinose transferase-like glycosyltransferase
LSGRDERAALLGALLLLLLLQLLAAARLTPTYDEPTHRRYGLRLLHGDATRFDDSKMPISASNALPTRLAEALPAGRVHDALAGWVAARLPTMLATAALATLVWAWSRRLWGPLGGLLSLLLTVFDPNLLAHGALVTTDLWTALATTLVFFLAWRLAQAPSWPRAAALGAALGAALAVKYTALLLLPILAALAALAGWPRLRAAAAEGRRSLARLALRVLAGAMLAGVLALLVLNASFLFQGTGTRPRDYAFLTRTLQRVAHQPLLGALPAPLPQPWLQGLDWVRFRERTGRGYGLIYLRGELRHRQGFATYYLWAWLYKVPLGTQILLLSAAVVAWRRRAALRWREDLAFLLLPALVFAVYLNVGLRAQLGVRLSLLVFPPLSVLAGILLARPAAVALPQRLALAAACTWTVVSVLSWAPFYLCYFDELVSDRAQAWRVLADSNLDWGQSDGELRRFAQKHPEAQIAPEHAHPGLLVVSANALAGIDGERWAWLRPLRPVGHVGYGFVVFDVQPQDLP